MNEKEIRGAIRGLMLADNLGDVHEEIDRLRKAVGLPATEGNFLDGFTDADFEALDTGGEESRATD